MSSELESYWYFMYDLSPTSDGKVDVEHFIITCKPDTLIFWVKIWCSTHLYCCSESNVNDPMFPWPNKNSRGDLDSFDWILFMATCECALRSPSLLIQGSCFVLIKVCLTLSFFALLPCYIYSLTMLCLNRLCRCLLQVPLLRSTPPPPSAVKVDICSRKEQGGSIFEVQKKLTKESL
jgi:hypothetical protein